LVPTHNDITDDVSGYQTLFVSHTGNDNSAQLLLLGIKIGNLVLDVCFSHLM